METIKIEELTNVSVGETATFEDTETGEMVTVMVKEGGRCSLCYFDDRAGCEAVRCSSTSRKDETAVSFKQIDLEKPEAEPKFTQKDLDACVTEYRVSTITIKKYRFAWVISVGTDLFLAKDILLFEVIPMKFLNENHLFGTALDAANFWFENKEKIK